MKKLHISRETLRTLQTEEQIQVAGGTNSRAFSDCRFCSLRGGSSCDPDHTNFSAQIACTR